MRILAIETSCDETAVALIEASNVGSGTSIKVVGNALYSQAETHSAFGGVFPMLAKREHAKNIVSLFASCITQAQNSDKKRCIPGLKNQVLQTLDIETKKKVEKVLDREDDLYEDLILFLEGFNDGKGFEMPHIDAIAVTAGPGLEPTLWVGISFAVALGIIFDLPVLPINHMEGHIASILSPDNDDSASVCEVTDGDLQAAAASQEQHSNKTIEFPALALLISGGHTELVDIESWGSYKVIGRTKDDAIGEAFDKVARILGLGYPGGPEISAHADRHRTAVQSNAIDPLLKEFDFTLPRPMLKTMDFDFSFSGLKTAVLYLVRDIKKKLIEKGTLTSDTDHLPKEIVAAIAAEFESAVTEVLVYKTNKAIDQARTKTIILGGGVVANTFIRDAFTKLVEDTNAQRLDMDKISLKIPPIKQSTDNAVMIGTIACVRALADNTYMNQNAIDTKKLDEGLQVSDLIAADGNLSL